MLHSKKETTVLTECGIHGTEEEMCLPLLFAVVVIVFVAVVSLACIHENLLLSVAYNALGGAPVRLDSGCSVGPFPKTLPPSSNSIQKQTSAAVAIHFVIEREHAKE